ncbi:hypothetical protein [Rossellomorea vietnamensis]|uniref:hypothetical protein n=1 Tax=Rossellomorea vietnamensis TaxID=218284 RepID=UPI001653CB99|nr:hypothetical protein [Rossellomorea vietnamensis]
MYSDPREEQAFAAMEELFGLPGGLDEEEEYEEPAESLTALLLPYFSEEEVRTTF